MGWDGMGWVHFLWCERTSVLCGSGHVLCLSFDLCVTYCCYVCVCVCVCVRVFVFVCVCVYLFAVVQAEAMQHLAASQQKNFRSLSPEDCIRTLLTQQKQSPENVEKAVSAAEWLGLTDSRTRVQGATECDACIHYGTRVGWR